MAKFEVDSDGKRVFNVEAHNELSAYAQYNWAVANLSALLEEPAIDDPSVREFLAKAYSITIENA